MLLIDSHAHLTDHRLNAQEIIGRMGENNLSRIVTVGFNLKTSQGAVQIASNHPSIYAAVGIHPSDVGEIKDGDLDKIRQLAQNERVVAIGESGLDYHYDNIDKPKQRDYFIQHILLAHELNLPLIIHLRDAYGDMAQIVEQYKNYFTNSAVMHCFSGSKEVCEFYVKMGFYISFSGVITFRNAAKYREIVCSVPKERLMIETDCPYLCPEPHRGGLNEPKNVRFTAMKMAEFLGISFDEVAKITSENTLRLFSRMK